MPNSLLSPLAFGFRAGVAARRLAYHRGWFQVRRLNRPVVSVGNLTVGGTGKTPLLAYIAQALLARGWTPSILTRGYGRAGGRLVALEPRPARRADPLEVGDEAAWLARTLPEVPIVVSADRHQAGRLAEHHFNVRLHLLDDGFQHWALHRDLDVVTLDSTRPPWDDALLPAGRLREPWPALRRAPFVVVTRVEVGDAGALENRVRAVHPQAKIFHSSTQFSGLAPLGQDVGSGQPADAMAGKPVLAFCGIGNPKAFFADLKLWGFSLAATETFRDHHRYSASDVARLGERARRAGAAGLVTTEKDAMNLASAARFDLPAAACTVKSEVNESALFRDALLAEVEATRRR